MDENEESLTSLELTQELSKLSKYDDIRDEAKMIIDLVEFCDKIIKYVEERDNKNFVN
jgi:hypothetical protein